ncbi:hypothetical protein [Parabacteroides sp. PF5-6]|uniref:hypothetical protein n=1 Tax=Parabacteroides sp. PF5-6 TaxID=1742403 RepID=UPI00240563F8|nr:hypothetical protein [Parabacteroides sp. PF5-6]MDF9830217.1 hypothetical protein [Parabacteroides sp. PF5-6]
MREFFLPIDIKAAKKLTFSLVDMHLYPTFAPLIEIYSDNERFAYYSRGRPSSH